ncbi:MAG: LysR family transcriptional regulator [Alphaproteobacteria bacterium]|nr:LysR family transcriptional regulator [Alphaproteobacteria bacterium]
MIDIEKLRSFYYVIKEGSLLKAAAVLEKNHTTLSKHLTDLEETYNVKLFTRKRKRIELTEKGEELFKVAQNTIPNLENGAAEILSPKAQPLRLRILTTTGVIGVWLIRKIKLLCEEFPDLRVAIITTNMDIDFEASKADVGVLHKQNTPGLSQKKLRTIHLSLYASKKYIEKNGKPKTIDDLSNHQIISFYSDYEGNLGNIDWHLKRNLPDHSLRESYLSVNSGILLFEAGCQDLGIIPMMDEFEYLEGSSLEKVLPEEKGPAIDLYYVFRSDVVLTKIQKRFFEILSS